MNLFEYFHQHLALVSRRRFLLLPFVAAFAARTRYAAAAPIGVHEAKPGPVVPAPAAAWLFGSGLIALAGFARRRRRSQHRADRNEPNPAIVLP